MRELCLLRWSNGSRTCADLRQGLNFPPGYETPHIVSFLFQAVILALAEGKITLTALRCMRQCPSPMSFMYSEARQTVQTTPLVGRRNVFPFQTARPPIRTCIFLGNGLK